jgi:hypothetical protein
VPRTDACPAWCTDHHDLSEGDEWMVEHWSEAHVGSARPRGAAPEMTEPTLVWVAQWQDDDVTEDATVVLDVPANSSGWTALSAAEARDLAAHLLQAADILDAAGVDRG